MHLVLARFRYNRHEAKQTGFCILAAHRPCLNRSSAQASTIVENRMSSDPSISIVVPTYNVEPFLEQCLQSLVDQTLPDLQIICIDDGSTDGSAAIMDRMAAQTGRLEVLHKENGGYGSAVNYGLDHAHGKYVGIVEPDDYVDPTMFDKLWNAAQAHSFPDIVKSSYWCVRNAGTSEEAIEPSVYTDLVSTVNAPFVLADDATFLFHHPSIWSAIYRRDFLTEHGIRMHEIPGAGWADNPWLIDTLVRAESIVYIDECLYYYREFNTGSSSLVKDPTILSDRWIDMDDIIRSLHVTSPRILEGHYNRGCYHIKALMEGFDTSDPLVKECIAKIVRRIDYSFVCDSERIGEGLKGALHTQVGILPRLHRRARGLLGKHHTIA